MSSLTESRQAAKSWMYNQPDFMHLFSGADGAVWYGRAIFVNGTLRHRGTMLRWQGRYASVPSQHSGTRRANCNSHEPIASSVQLRPSSL
jgi:hypothetical protein